MAIHDIDPERRNLTLLSLAIIVFYFAGGKLAVTPTVIRLNVINVVFERVDILILFLWLILLWFALRYWVTHRGMFIEYFRKDIETLALSAPTRLYLRLIHQTEYLVEGGYNHVDLKHRIGAWFISWNLPTRIHRDNKSRIQSFGHAKQTQPYELESFADKVFILLLMITASLTKPAFSSYAIPYILFYCAVATLIYSGNLPYPLIQLF